MLYMNILTYISAHQFTLLYILQLMLTQAEVEVEGMERIECIVDKRFKAEVINYSVAQQEVSMHIPLTRILAGNTFQGAWLAAGVNIKYFLKIHFFLQFKWNIYSERQFLKLVNSQRTISSPPSPPSLHKKMNMIFYLLKGDVRTTFHRKSLSQPQRSAQKLSLPNFTLK